MSEYTLAISDVEVARYRLMAEAAYADEAAAWAAAGVTSGAVVADVGCGPAAVSVLLARLVGPEGRVIGLERDPASLAAAQRMVADAGAANVELRAAEATATGIAPGSVDVVMMRHVLAHNGGREQAIVDHLATLARPGGHVYLVDVDLTAIRIRPLPPELADLGEAYVCFHQQRGNDPQVGLRLAELLRAAGLVEVTHEGGYTILPVVPGMRPPAYAAREAMVADGVASPADVARWEAAFARLDRDERRPTLFAPRFVAVGRQPT